MQRLMVAVGLVVLLVVLIVALVLALRSRSPKEPAQPGTSEAPDPVFSENVIVNGIDLSGKTRVEAAEALSPGLEYTAANIAATLQGDGFAYRITGEEMGVASDLDSVLDAALEGGPDQYYYTNWHFDYQLLANRIAEINESFETGPTDATFDVKISDSGKPEFVYSEGKPGYGLDTETTEEMIRQALENGQLQPVLEPALTMVEPQVTVADIKANTTLRASFTTTFRADGTSEMPDEQREILQNRSFNISKGAGLINGMTVKVGETVSFNKVVGARTEERGWKLANAIIFGNQYTLEPGGGICQVSTTLYGALLRGHVQIVTRRHHSIPSDYVDLGLDATVDTGHIDFKFKNDTGHPLYVFCYVTKNRTSNRRRDLTVAIYGEALPKGITYQPRSELIEEIDPGEPKIINDRKKTEDYSEVIVTGRKGYVIDVYLDMLQNGKTVYSEKLYTDEYKAVQEQIKVGTLPLETPTPVPTATPRPTPEP